LIPARSAAVNKSVVGADRAAAHFYRVDTGQPGVDELPDCIAVKTRDLRIGEHAAFAFPFPARLVQPNDLREQKPRGCWVGRLEFDRAATRRAVAALVPAPDPRCSGGRGGPSHDRRVAAWQTSAHPTWSPALAPVLTIW